jgi:hypothetical protein
VSSWVNRSVLSGSSVSQNGTTSHTCTFTAATSGSLLVAVVAGSVTCSTPTGWTLVQNAILDASVCVFSKTASASESSFTTNHNASNYPIQGVVYEFPSSSSIIGTAGSANLGYTDPGPSFSGSSNTVYTRFCARATNTDSTGVAQTVWTVPSTVDYEAYVNATSGADGVYLGIAYDDGCVSGAFTAYAGTSTTGSVGVDIQAVAFAVSSTATTPTPRLEQSDSIGSAALSSSTNAGYARPVLAGDLLVVAVSYRNAGVTASVTDSMGNTYSIAAGRTASGTLGFSNYIFYAVAGSTGSNTVTVTYAQAVDYTRTLIHEYQGVDTFDVGSSATGASGAPDSGSATTTRATELIFGWGITDNGTTSPGTGFTLRQTALSESTEDKIVSSAGSYTVVYPNDGTAWIAQMATFYYGTTLGISSGITSWIRA